MEFVTRLYFLAQYFPEKMGQAVDRQRAEAQAHIGRLQKACANLPPEQIYNRMSLDLRLQQLTTVLEWLDDCQKDFQRV